MNRDQRIPLSPPMAAAIAEMKQVIARQYPTTTFSVYEWDDPAGIYLAAVIDTEDLEAVHDLVIDRMVELQVEEGLPLFVIPQRTPERHAAVLAREAREEAVLTAT